MASHFFNEAKRAFAAGEIDFDSDSLVAVLCMTNTSADIDYDVDTVSAITTLDEFDGASHTWGHGNSGRLALTITITETAGAPGVGHAKIDATDIVWTALAAGTRSAQGILIIKSVTGDSDNVPICWAEFGSPYSASGADLDIVWHADGIVKFGFGS